MVPGSRRAALHQARDAGAVVAELLVAGHAVDVDDIDDGVLRADPHLVLLHHRHAVLQVQDIRTQSFSLLTLSPQVATPSGCGQVPTSLQSHFHQPINTQLVLCVSV